MKSKNLTLIQTARKIDPAQFVVRRDSYWQVEGYPEACAQLTEELLEYLSYQAGLTVPFAKLDVDLNTKAMTRPVEKFMQEWDNGDYFDTGVTSQEIMDWHRKSLINTKSYLQKENRRLIAR